MLKTWIQSQVLQVALFNGIATHLAHGFKAVKGRLLLLQWTNTCIQCIEPKQAIGITSSIMDCLTDKSSAVRAEATKTMQALCSKLSLNEIEPFLKGRPSPDVKAIHAIIDPLYNHPQPRTSIPLPRTSIPEARISDMDARKQSLSSRSGARVLKKPKPGEGLSNRFNHVKSSIPKPMPRRSTQRTSSESAAPERYSCLYD